MLAASWQHQSRRRSYAADRFNSLDRLSVLDRHVFVFRVFLLAQPLAKVRNSQQTPDNDVCFVAVFSVLQRCCSTEKSQAVIARLGIVSAGCFFAEDHADRHDVYGNTCGNNCHQRVKSGNRSARLIVFQRFRSSGVVNTSNGGADGIGEVGV
jgi:hypothetical protein